MNRNLASALAVGATAAVAVGLAAVGPNRAYADDITPEGARFVGSKSRSEVRAELVGQAELLRARTSEWTLQNNEVPRIRSAYTRRQAQAEYKNARQYVSALTGEDSGSAYFIKSRVPPGVDATTMGAPAR